MAADVERFVDREVESAGGTGISRVHDTGDVDRAYLSLSAWNSAEETNLVTDTTTHRVRCAGSTADDTAVTISTGWVSNASFFLTVQGDDAAPDDDGFNDTNKVWSTGHYRMEQSSSFDTLRNDTDFSIIDGLQLQCTKNNANSNVVRNASLGDTSTIKNCRVTKAGTSGVGILGHGSRNFDSNIISNIVFDCATAGIRSGSAGADARIHNVINNTVFDCGIGLDFVNDDADLTYNWFNNALFNNTTDINIGATATFNHDWNAGEDNPPTGETNGFDIGTLTLAMTTPGGTMKDRIVQVKDSDSSLFKGSEITADDPGEVPSVDIVGNTRNTATGTSTSVGAWANISEAAGVTLIPADLTQLQVFDAVTMTQGHVIASVDLDMLLVFNGVTITQDHILASVEINMLMVIDGVTITQGHVLAANELTMLVLLDTSVVTEGLVLTPNDLDMLVFIDAVAVTQVHTLPSFDLDMLMVLDSPGFVQDFVLPAVDLTMLIVLDQATMTQSHVLAAVDLDMLVILDGAVVTQGHVLSATELAMLVVLDATTITIGAVTLAAADLTMLLLLDAPSFVQNHQLAANELDMLVFLDAAVVNQGHVIASAGLDLLVVLDATDLVLSHVLAAVNLDILVVIDAVSITQGHVLASQSLDVLVVFDTATILGALAALAPSKRQVIVQSELRQVTVAVDRRTVIVALELRNIEIDC